MFLLWAVSATHLLRSKRLEGKGVFIVKTCETRRNKNSTSAILHGTYLGTWKRRCQGGSWINEYTELRVKPCAVSISVGVVRLSMASTSMGWTRSFTERMYDERGLRTEIQGTWTCRGLVEERDLPEKGHWKSKVHLETKGPIISETKERKEGAEKEEAVNPCRGRVNEKRKDDLWVWWHGNQ